MDAVNATASEPKTIAIFLFVFFSSLEGIFIKVSCA